MGKSECKKGLLYLKSKIGCCNEFIIQLLLCKVVYDLKKVWVNKSGNSNQNCKISQSPPPPQKKTTKQISSPNSTSFVELF